MAGVGPEKSCYDSRIKEHGAVKLLGDIEVGSVVVTGSGERMLPAGG